MGKDMKVQKIKEERDQIKLRIKENEMKIKYIEVKIHQKSTSYLHGVDFAVSGNSPK
jgi:pyruvate dehydrogenase complex dehydrogenase (E1) component